jgi:hypothetical protein
LKGTVLKKPPARVTLTSEEGEALIERVYASDLPRADCTLVVQIIRLHFWLMLVVQEAKLSLKRFRQMLFGEPSKGRSEAASEPSAEAGEGSPALDKEKDRRAPRKRGGHRQGQGRLGEGAYVGAERRTCRHEALAAGERCPLCDQGNLYLLPAGVEIRVDGNALLSAIRYELEKLRCSACGAVFSAKLPDGVGAHKYSPRARSALALGRYYLGLPFYRIESYQAMLGVPVPDATQWDQVEALADGVYPVYEHLLGLAAQGEVIYQDDTSARLLELIRANRQAQDGDDSGTQRRGMYTTALVVQAGERRICLYATGRSHAGENLASLLSKRSSGLARPLVMSDALSSNEADETALIRCHCLAHSQRKFRVLEDDFPDECARVMSVFKAVFEHDEQTRKTQMSAAARLAYHQLYSAPLMNDLKLWLEKQFADRNVEPNSSLGKAITYVLSHFETLTQFLRIEGAPIDNNIAERALKLFIRQRKNSLFFATEHSAYIASLLTTLIATCVQAGVNAFDYLVALQDNRKSVFANPEMWLPWNYAHSRASP